MFTIEQAISELSASAETDDVSFDMVIDAWRELDEAPPGEDDTERMINFMSLLLDHGFIPVSSPYADPPSAPWPEKGSAAILSRLRREWLALDHDLTFLDVCWFHRPGRQ